MQLSHWPNQACRGPKVLLGEVSRRCYRKAKPMAQSGEVRRIGRGFALTISGSTKDDDDSCNITAGNRHVEGREIRHLRFLARHRLRMVRLLSLRHAGAVLRR